MIRTGNPLDVLTVLELIGLMFSKPIRALPTNGAEGVDDVNNILALPDLQSRVLEIHPRIAPLVAAGEADILYDPFTFQVLIAFRRK